jgi:energy-coupling factor transporter ATP-binding protein EcfA2
MVRQAKERLVWDELKLAHARAIPEPFEISLGASLDLSRPCTVLGGRNGSGKSRLLRAIASQTGPGAVYIDLHHLCEQALIVLRGQKNLAETKDELGVIGPTRDRLNDVERIVGRDYDSVEWFALDLGPVDKEVVERFQWGGDELLTPYFVVSYRGAVYDAKEMGLGEFSVHFLLWILEQYRDREDLLLLLDEPDAFLPPVGVEALLARLLGICQKRRGWRMVVSTHSEEMISAALEHDAFLLLRMGEGGAPEAFHSSADATIADTLLARPPIERVVFVEDESAWYFGRALLDASDRGLSRTTSLVWGDGYGYLTVLRDRIPRPQATEIAFALVPDGDQRSRMSDGAVEGRWPLHFLPTDHDPDALFRTLRSDVPTLAIALGVNQTELQRLLDDLEGVDDHDWVNQLGATYGRPHVLTVLAGLWADGHKGDAEEFVARLRAGV